MLFTLGAGSRSRLLVPRTRSFHALLAPVILLASGCANEASVSAKKTNATARARASVQGIEGTDGKVELVSIEPASIALSQESGNTLAVGELQFSASGAGRELSFSIQFRTLPELHQKIILDATSDSQVVLTTNASAERSTGGWLSVSLNGSRLSGTLEAVGEGYSVGAEFDADLAISCMVVQPRGASGSGVSPIEGSGALSTSRAQDNSSEFCAHWKRALSLSP
jgi:hypothetical protein